MASFTPEELEAMRLADEEIEREFVDLYVADQVHKEMGAWLDELAIQDLMDHKSYHRRKQQRKYSAAYREAHKAAYNDYMREYMRNYRRGIRRKDRQLLRGVQDSLQVEPCM